MTTRSIENEIQRGLAWFDFPGYEDRYQITIDGQVRSKPRYVNSPICGGRRMIGGKVLKPAMVKGYLAIQPVINGTHRTVYLHRAIAALFVPNPENKPHVNHIDGNKANISVGNLEWCTHKENMSHAHRTGLANAPVIGPGEKCPASKLTDTKVRDIKTRLARGERHRDIAAVYGVSNGTIGFIARGETWAHIEAEK